MTIKQMFNTESRIYFKKETLRIYRYSNMKIIGFKRRGCYIIIDLYFPRILLVRIREIKFYVYRINYFVSYDLTNHHVSLNILFIGRVYLYDMIVYNSNIAYSQSISIPN